MNEVYGSILYDGIVLAVYFTKIMVLLAHAFGTMCHAVLRLHYPIYIFHETTISNRKAWSKGMA